MKPSKYKNIKTAAGDSKKEVRRYQQLLLLEKAGSISGLKKQVPYELIPKQYREDGTCERAVKYVADYWYMSQMYGVIVEDVKSDFTRKLPVYVIKRKLMLFIHGIEILET
jgi:Protein of unknown function (DUF1064)